MSSFTDPLSYRNLPGGRIEILKPFDYHVGSEESEEVVTVPEGFVSDGASIPRWLWTIVGHPFKDEYVQSAVLHDYLLAQNYYTREETDRIFYESLHTKKMSQVKRWLMWKGVRLDAYFVKVKKSFTRPS